MSSAEMKNVAESTQNGAESAAANRKLPAGGPANWLVTVSAAYMRPLAVSSRSGRTMAGIIAWAALSNSVSHTPMARAMAYRGHIGASLARPSSAMQPTRRPRATLTRHITRRRSRRSTIAPAGREKSSQGSVNATVRPAIRRASRVSVAANSGSAAALIPSPRFDTVLAVHRRQ
jgi:hypothetical protein